MTEVKIFIPEIKMWCEKCHRWTLAERVVFGGHFVDVHCSECHLEQPYKITTDTIHPKEEPAPPLDAPPFPKAGPKSPMGPEDGVADTEHGGGAGANRGGVAL